MKRNIIKCASAAVVAAVFFLLIWPKADAAPPMFHIKKTTTTCTDDDQGTLLMSRTWRFRSDVPRTVHVKQISDLGTNEFDTKVWPKPGGAWITLHLREAGKMVVRYDGDVIFKRVIDRNVCVS